ncbi:MAG: sulfite exporter TauE/SafE family protein [Alphaproteobacteria bacterium]
MDWSFLLYVVIGFVAQLVDSALGMAFGSLSSGVMLSIGFPPQALSATVHMAEIFGGGAAAVSHWRLGNLDFSLLKKLTIPAIAGAVLGTFLVTHIDNTVLKPLLGVYFLVIGLVIVVKALRPTMIRIMTIRQSALGFVGGFLDAFGGAGWGEFVSSGLLLRGHNVRNAIGSLVAAEFMVAVTVSVIFYTTTGTVHWLEVIALALGAVAAAPLGAWLCKRTPLTPLTALVGLLVAALGLKALL